MALFDRDAEVWNSLGVAYWKTGEFDKARGHFEQALALDADDAIYNDNMGSFFVATALRVRSAQDVEKALGYFDKAIAADPELASAYNGKAGALKILGRRDEAVKDWEKALALNPGSSITPPTTWPWPISKKGTRRRHLNTAGATWRSRDVRSPPRNGATSSP